MLKLDLDYYQKNNKTFWYNESSLGVMYEIDVLDAEKSELSLYKQSIESFVCSLSSNVKARFYRKSNFKFENEKNHSRKIPLSEIGWVENKIIICIELELSLINLLKRKEFSLDQSINDLENSYNLQGLIQLGLNPINLNKSEIRELFPDPKLNKIKEELWGLDFGDFKLGVLALEKQSTYTFSEEQFANVEYRIPKPYIIHTSIKKKSKKYSESLLRLRSKRTRGEIDQINQSKYVETEDLLASVALSGNDLLEIEMSVFLKRPNQKEILEDLVTSKEVLKGIGEFKEQSVGALPNLISIHPGEKSHIPFLESAPECTLYLPILSYGESEAKTNLEDERRKLFLHRKDSSLYGFDLFNKDYNNYSACVFGLSGLGKSVLVNLLIRSLAQDENIDIVIVDVGGSHSKTVKMLGGTEYHLRFDKPSGMNPFKYLKHFDQKEEICNILSGFVENLIMENDEKMMSKSLKATLEKSLLDYSTKFKNPSLREYFEVQKDIPRRDILERWIHGVFKNAFIEDSSFLDSRVKYFNFPQISQAKDQDFGVGSFVAIMADFNAQMVLNKGRKKAFINDEVTFFINRAFGFYKFSTSNIRKYNGSFVTICQKSSDPIVNGDRGIIENSNSKFLFSLDADKEEFRKNLNLSSSDTEKVENLGNVKGQFSECLLVDNLASKTLRIELTDEEYWTATSSKEDNEKIHRLIEAVPGLKIQEAIRCLSINP
jgi:hypothetical protein